MHRMFRAMALLVGGLLAAGLAFAAPASATQIKQGFGKIDGVGLDLGQTIDSTTGEAVGLATFSWDLSIGVTKLNVTGQYGATGRSGVAVRLEVSYYTSIDGTGPAFSSAHVPGFTPANDQPNIRWVNWTPAGGVGVQSAKVCTASDADNDGSYVRERCILSNIA
jgi:hypothetical protein